MIINYNQLGYSIYLPFTLFVTFWVGKELHNKGRPLMEIAFTKYDFQEWVTPINNSLLIGFYLLNAGNILVFINTWEHIATLEQMVAALTKNIGFIITLLGVIHLFNMIALTAMNFKTKTVKRK